MNCSDCRFWSNMIARGVGDTVQAMCLYEKSPMCGKYTLDRHGCKEGLTGIFGAVDAPGNENAYDEYNSELQNNDKITTKQTPDNADPT